MARSASCGERERGRGVYIMSCHGDNVEGVSESEGELGRGGRRGVAV
jgi:hypothetical protein